jgi:hypothetical protein
MKDQEFKLTPSEFIDGVGTDLKLSIDDIIHEIKKNRKDIIKIKKKLGIKEDK